MTKINLRDFYPFYNVDYIIEVSDEVAGAMFETERQERNYIRCRFYNKAHYSLDIADGIEHDICFVSLSPCELYERRLTMEQLFAALNALPDKQGYNRPRCRSPPFLLFRLSAPNRRKQEESKMAQYKRIPLEFVEYTELARKSYRDYERGNDAPDEAEIEAGWIAERKKLYQILDKLTSRQRQIYIMKVGYGLEEKEIAEKLGLTQQAVSDRYRRAEKKLRQFRK